MRHLFFKLGNSTINNLSWRQNLLKLIIGASSIHTCIRPFSAVIFHISQAELADRRIGGSSNTYKKNSKNKQLVMIIIILSVQYNCRNYTNQKHTALVCTNIGGGILMTDTHS